MLKSLIVIIIIIIITRILLRLPQYEIGCIEKRHTFPLSSAPISQANA